MGSKDNQLVKNIIRVQTLRSEILSEDKHAPQNNEDATWAKKWGTKSYRGKKSMSVFDFLTGFSFSYEKVEGFDRPIGPLDKIDGVSKFDNSLSFGAKQKAL